MPHHPFRSRRAQAAGLALLGSLGLAATAWAYPISTSARPVAPAIGFSPRAGTYLLVWAEDRNQGTGLDLYAARLNRSGVVAGYDMPLVVAPGNQSDPAMAFSEQLGQFLVVYTDDGGGQSGETATPGLPIPGGTPGSTPPVPPPPPVPFGLALEGLDAGPRLDAAEAAGAGADQPPLPTPGGPSPTPGGPTPPGGATPGAPPGVPGARDIHGLWVTDSGQRASVIFPVVSSPADDTFPDLAYMPRGGAGDRIAFVWREVTGVDSAISGLELQPFGRFFSLSAKRVVVSGGDLGRPSVAAEVPSGEYLVAWSQTPTNDPARDLYGRRLNANAFPFGPVIKMVEAKAPVDDTYPSLGSLGPFGGYLLSWERRDGAAAPDIQTRRLNRNGIPYRNQNSLAGGPAFSFAGDVSSSDLPTTLVVWLDRNAASDHSIMLAEVTRDGRRIGPERVVVTGGAGPGALTPVAPPGFPTIPPPPLPTP